MTSSSTGIIFGWYLARRCCLLTEDNTMANSDYDIIKISLEQADKALAIFKTDLSPTSLEALARHIARHIVGMLAAEPKQMHLVATIMGLMLKQTCDKEARALLRAEEAADAATDK